MVVSGISTGRYGEKNKVSLNVTIDKTVSDRLHKIKKKGSVSSMVNSLLDMITGQFDPGPSSPLIYDLHDLLKRHRKKAEQEGDPKRVACVEIIESHLQPYFDLAEVNDDKFGHHLAIEAHSEVIDSSKIPKEPIVPEHDYSWYSVPRICHRTPMVYSRKEGGWRCTICHVLYRED